MEAAGFAAAIIAFIDFSCKVIKGSNELYHSSTGTTKDQDRIGEVARDLETATRELQPCGPTTGAAKGDRHSQALSSLASGCIEVSSELMAILAHLERKDGNKAWRSFEAKWKAMRKERAISALEQRLDSYRSQLLLRLQLIVEEKQTAIQNQLDIMRESDIFRKDMGLDELENIHEAITSLDEKVTMELAGLIRADGQKQLDAMAGIRDDLTEVLRKLNTVPEKTSADIRVLNWLYFSSMHTRLDSISKAEFGTFQWILSEDEEAKPNPGEPRWKIEGWEHRDSSRRKFQSWLETGTGVFHLSGKAGSGKSTLMKSLCDDSRLSNKLQVWSGAEKVIFASFFFWNSGDKDQKSLTGLYRSLLFEILRQCPELIKIVFPDIWVKSDVTAARWESASPRLEQLHRAMSLLGDDRLGKGQFRHLRFCFFIDGLDEYEGDGTDHVELARLLKQWAALDNVKICVSSRPHAEFLDIFNANLRVDLHELTGLDIGLFISGVLQREGLNNNASIERLTQVIQEGADGVFLWVCLAVRSLLDGQRHRYSEKSLLKRVYSLPRGIDALYEQMLGRISPEDRQRADKLFLLALSDQFSGMDRASRMNLLTVSWIDELDDPDFPFDAQVSALSTGRIEDDLETSRYMLQGLTHGLLESRKLTGRRPENEHHIVEFFHLTVYEYLRCSETLTAMKQRVGDFDVEDAGVRLRLACVKVLPAIDVNFDMEWARFSLQQALRWPLTRRITDHYELVLRQHALEGLEFRRASLILEYSKPPPRKRISRRNYVAKNGLSFLHLLAAYGQMEAVLHRIQADKSLLQQQEDGGPVVLLSACLSALHFWSDNLGSVFHRKPQLVEELLRMGARVDQPFVAFARPSSVRDEVEAKIITITTTVWVAFLWDLCHATLDGNAFDSVSQEPFKFLEILLREDPPADIEFVVAYLFTTSRDESGDGYVSDSSRDSSSAIDTDEKGDEKHTHKYVETTITLEELIMFSMPPNCSILLKQIGGLKGGQEVECRKLEDLTLGRKDYVAAIRVGDYTLRMDSVPFEIPLF